MKDSMKEIMEQESTYADMIDWCCGDQLILNNSISEVLLNCYSYVDVFCGSIVEKDEEGLEVCQEYIITRSAAECLRAHTNETVLYFPDADLYLLQVYHYGTSWDHVPANWKS